MFLHQVKALGKNRGQRRSMGMNVEEWGVGVGL